MTEDEAIDVIGNLLRAIQEHPRVNLTIPHGFEVRSVRADERPKHFTTNLVHWRVTAEIDAPVVYSYTTPRAHLPAITENLDGLERAVVSGHKKRRCAYT